MESWTDAVIVALLLGGMYLGYRRGLVRQLVSLTGWLIAYVGAFMLYDDAAVWLVKLPIFQPSESVTAGSVETAVTMSVAGKYVGGALAFALLFFGFKLLLTAVGWILHGVASLPVLRTVNRTGGVLLGFVETAVIVAVILLVMQELPSERLQSWSADSTIFAWIKSHSPLLLDSFQSLWRKE